MMTQQTSHALEIHEYLLATERIRTLKASYWYAMDTKQFEKLAALFTDDAVADFRTGRDLKPGEDYATLPPIDQALRSGDPMVVQGNTAIAAFIASGVKDWITVHLGAAPIIEILSSDAAKGIWPIFDILDNGRQQLRAYGHYHDTYRHVGDGWRISSFYLTRLRVDGEHPRHSASPPAAT